MNRKVFDDELVTARRLARRGTVPAAGVELPEIKLGVHLKHARLAKGLRLKTLAAEVGCTESFLSKVENNKTRPSLAILHRIVSILGINIARLFDSDASETGPVALTRAAERQAAEKGSAISVAVDRLAVGSQLIEANIHRLDRGAASSGLEHEGEALAYVIGGDMELSVAGNSYRLREGDSAFFKSSLPHGYRNCGESKLSVLWIHTPPVLRS